MGPCTTSRRERGPARRDLESPGAGGRRRPARGRPLRAGAAVTRTPSPREALAVVALAALATAATAQGDAAAATFDDSAAVFYVQRCSGCHTIGGGELSGPDLAPSTQWPADDLRVAVERMEKNVGPMTAEQVDGQVRLLQDPAVKGRLEEAREALDRRAEAELEEPPSAAKGEGLFHGRLAFANRGLACAACHVAGGRGGDLAASLSDAAARLGRAALVSAAERPGYPLMKASYADSPVTHQEAVHLAEYLVSLQPEAGTQRSGSRVAVAGAGSAVALVALAALVALPRGRGAGVRRRMLEASRRRQR